MPVPPPRVVCKRRPRSRLSAYTFFFKHDYYDKEMKFGSDEPSDPQVTTRVLTLLLNSDY